MFCVDASVMVSAARGGERHSAASAHFLSRVKAENLKVFLPELAVPEIASGLMRATKNAPFVRAFTGGVRNVPNFSFVALDSNLSNLAVTVIAETGLRGADAVYVALALDYGLTLITLDNEQLKKGQKLVAVRTP